MIILSAALGSLWLMAEPAPVPEGTVSPPSELASVDNEDIAGALSTLTPALQSELRKAGGKCPAPLAWVAVFPQTGQPPGTVRLISGGYYSPVFKMSGTPLRIAIPYPASYETGHGILTILHTGGDAAIALRPALHLTPQSARITREVTWHPSQRCKSNG